jgi:phospholipid-binding lipoprotein MlaA
MNLGLKKILPLLATALLAVACSSAKTSDPADPLEAYNRGAFAFNQTVDEYVFRPIAWGYRYVTPTPIRQRVGNFTDNLMEPVSMVNAFLQGNFQAGMRSFWRFALNSTVGIAGLHDVASEAGIREQDEDFGQTLAVWGVGSGPYIIIPFFGPSNPRDAFGKVTDWFISPVNLAINDDTTEYALGGVQALVARERLLDPIDDIYDTSIDPYATFRSIYMQRRDAQIRNLQTDQPKL